MMQNSHGSGQVCSREHIEARHRLHAVPQRLCGLLLGREDLYSVQLLLREAVFGFTFRRAEQRRRIEVAGRNVGDQAVAYSVESIAGIHH